MALIVWRRSSCWRPSQSQSGRSPSVRGENYKKPFTRTSGREGILLKFISVVTRPCLWRGWSGHSSPILLRKLEEWGIEIHRPGVHSNKPSLPWYTYIRIIKHSYMSLISQLKGNCEHLSITIHTNKSNPEFHPSNQRKKCSDRSTLV